MEKCAGAEHRPEAQVFHVGALAIGGFIRRRLLTRGSSRRTKARARALFAAAVLAGERGDQASADTLINESQDIALQLGDKTGVAVSLNALAVFARDRGGQCAHPVRSNS